MKNFRLKKEAVKYFKEKHATSIYSFDTWDELGVDEKALEEVEEMYIKYGHQSKTIENASTLCGWDEKGSHFHFTICFPSVKHCEHDKFSQGKPVRKLMNKMQRNINDFYILFVNGDGE